MRSRPSAAFGTNCMDRIPWFEIGPHSKIDDDVVLGYCFEGDSRPLRIGSHAVIRSGSILYTNTLIGNRSSCGHMALIRGGIMIGNRVVVHHKVTLEGNLSIGSGAKIMAHVYIPSQTRIGNLVFIGPNVTILNDKKPQSTTQRIGLDGVTIEDHVTVGGGVTICPGVTVGERSFLAAGSVITKDVLADVLAIGVPARFQSLPEEFACGNLPELMLPQGDLFGGWVDQSWRDEESL